MLFNQGWCFLQGRRGEGQTGHDWTEPCMAKPFPGWNVCEIPAKAKHIPVSTSKRAPQGGLDPLTTLPGSPKTSSEAGEWLEKPQNASWAGKNDRGKESGQGSSRDAVISTQTGGWPCWKRAEGPGDTQIPGLQWRGIREGIEASLLVGGRERTMHRAQGNYFNHPWGHWFLSPSHAVKPGHSQHPFAGTSSTMWEVSSTFWGPSLCRGGFPGT